MHKHHQKIVEHIKQRIGLGHDIVHIKHHLLSRGIILEDAHEAIDHAYKELEGQALRSEALSSFFSPTPFKLWIAVTSFLIMLLYVGSFSYVGPIAGELACSQKELEVQLGTAQKRNLTIEMEQYKQKILEVQSVTKGYYQLLGWTSLPLRATRIHMLNPFFPTDCATQSLISSSVCMHYLDREQVHCLGEKQAYRPLILMTVFLMLAVIVAQMYLLACVVTYAIHLTKNYAHRQETQTVERVVLIIVISIILISIVLLLFWFRSF